MWITFVLEWFLSSFRTKWHLLPGDGQQHCPSQITTIDFTGWLGFSSGVGSVSLYLLLGYSFSGSASKSWEVYQCLRTLPSIFPLKSTRLLKCLHNFSAFQVPQQDLESNPRTKSPITLLQYFWKHNFVQQSSLLFFQCEAWCQFSRLQLTDGYSSSQVVLPCNLLSCQICFLLVI